MAIYMFSARIHGRQARDLNGKAVKGSRVSIVAKAAYRSGERLHDEQAERTFDYRSRSQEVCHAEILAPDGAPAWAHDREALWNQVEMTERRSDSQLAREYVIALPVELTEEQQAEAVRGWCESEIVAKGQIADFAIHRSHDGENPHAHILTTLRGCDEDGFAAKKPSTAGKWMGRGAAGGETVDELAGWRTSWERHCNEALEAAGSEERVDCRTLEAQGIDREPEPKLGAAATAMERRGVETERGTRLRQVQLENHVRPMMRQVREQGEIHQDGAGESWWERADVSLAEGARELHDFWWETPFSSGGDWRSFIETERGHEPEEPEMDYG